jgi:epsilon-lactone hydrolase
VSESLFKIRGYMLKKKQAQAGAKKTPLEKRADSDAAMLTSVKLPQGTTVEKAETGELDGLWVSAANVPEANPKTVIYYHGGGFFCGSAETHKGMAAAISEASGARVLVIDYRLYPEHKYPAAHEDALAAYRAVLSSGVPARDIALGGDSAGAMLALDTALAARDAGLDLPGAVFLLSPWLDIEGLDMESYRSRAALDPMVDAEETVSEAEAYFGSAEIRRKIATLRKEMKGLPPLLIQVGDQEILLSDAQRLAEKATAAGVDVTLEVWPELWHVFQALTAILPEAVEAMGHVGSFLKEKLDA